MKTFGKGSVQTIIPLKRPRESALRLTTALYYTPADVTINKNGILPDVEVPFPKDMWMSLFQQMQESMADDPTKQNTQNHGTVTGNEKTDVTVEDVQLQRAVEILKEDGVWENLLNKYHKDTKETQVAAVGGDHVEKSAVSSRDPIAADELLSTQ
jgi:carboxyl-terminal processing protease